MCCSLNNWKLRRPLRCYDAVFNNVTIITLLNRSSWRHFRSQYSMHHPAATLIGQIQRPIPHAKGNSSHSVTYYSSSSIFLCRLALQLIALSHKIHWTDWHMAVEQRFRYFYLLSPVSRLPCVNDVIIRYWACFRIIEFALSCSSLLFRVILHQPFCIPLVLLCFYKLIFLSSTTYKSRTSLDTDRFAHYNFLNIVASTHLSATPSTLQ